MLVRFTPKNKPLLRFLSPSSSSAVLQSERGVKENGLTCDFAAINCSNHRSSARVDVRVCVCVSADLRVQRAALNSAASCRNTKQEVEAETLFQQHQTGQARASLANNPSVYLAYIVDNRAHAKIAGEQ